MREPGRDEHHEDADGDEAWDGADELPRSEGRLAAPESVLGGGSAGGGRRRGQVEPVRGALDARPWGSEETWGRVDGCVGRILRIRAGEAFSLHMHEERDEVLHLLSGVVELEAGTGLEAVRPVRFEVGDSVVLPPGILHRVTAVEDAVVLELSSGEDDDRVRVRDRYGRVSG
jgi:mannose-6-phosphate isomerase